MGPWMLSICSAMCDSGRYDSSASSGPAPVSSSATAAVHARLRCESITPFGGPVVPDV